MKTKTLVAYLLLIFLATTNLSATSLATSTTYIRISASGPSSPILLNIGEGKVRMLRARGKLPERYAPGLGFSPEQYDFSEGEDTIRLNGSNCLLQSQIGADTLVLNNKSGKIKYEKVPVTLSSGYFSSNVINKNLSFFILKTRRYYLGPPQDCARGRYGVGETVYEIDFIGSHSIIQAGQTESFFAFGTYVIDRNFGEYTILTGREDGTLAATSPSQYNASHKSDVEITEITSPKLPFTLISEPFVHDYDELTDLLGKSTRGQDKYLAINDAEKILVDTSTYLFKLEYTETETRLLANDVLVKSYAPLSLSPSGRAFFAQDDVCEILLIDDYKDNGLEIIMRLDVFYGKELESKTGRSGRFKFSLSN